MAYRKIKIVSVILAAYLVIFNPVLSTSALVGPPTKKDCPSELVIGYEERTWGSSDHMSRTKSKIPICLISKENIPLIVAGSIFVVLAIAAITVFIVKKHKKKPKKPSKR
jgi:hypothetical protein